MALLILYLLVAIVFSFFCSISEAVLLSVRPSYVSNLKHKKPKKAQILEALQNNLDRPLAAILTTNTVAHTVGAVGVGAQAGIVFGNHSIGVVSAVMTLLILVFSEIIPKTLGARYWQELAPALAMPIYLLTKALLPFVWLSEQLTRLFSKKNDEHTFSRDEMKAMAEIGAEEGLLDSKEFKIIANLMKLQKLSVREIMTPRSVVFSVSENMTVKNYFDAHADKPFSRIPLYKKDPDDVAGYLLRSDLLLAQAKDEFDRTLSEFKRDALIIPDKLKASDVYDALMVEKSHIALVMDEYGTLQGLVALEDVVETLIGSEITDELDTIEDMQTLANKLWRSRMEAIGIDPDSIQKKRVEQT